MVTITGGSKLEAALKKIADSAKNAASVRVGFLAGATYPDGTSVPFVAAMNEFGHGIGRNPGAGNPDTRDHVPPRPFFRNMVADKSPEWPGAIAALLKTNDYDAQKTLSLTGEAIAGQLRESITKFTDPPLRPSTIARKGFSKPLIDTGHMLNSVDYEVS